ncbi:MAG: RluA family pseudouridine synthase [Acidobacteriota bacterium]|nr:RluA family pseudouridine synthase [Acidobacteriota bacterium]
MSRPRRDARQPVTVEADGAATLTVLVRRALELSHAKARALVEAGAVSVDGAPETGAACRPAAGSVVEIVARPGPPPPRSRASLEGPGFRVVHLDRDLLVVDKAPGVVTIPTSVRREDPDDPSLVALVGATLAEAGHRVRRLFVVHRIDRETSGLVAFARHERGANALRRQFRQRSPLREYLAWTEGVPEPASGTLIHELGVEEDSPKVRVAVVGEDGRTAELAYEVEAFRARRAARVRVRLVTGRRNQIRVQLAASGWPIVGDRYYGAKMVGSGRAALHACRLEFVHPGSGKQVAFVSHPAADLVRLDARLLGARRLSPPSR